MNEEKVYCSMYSRNAELYHHGIQGQKWGVRNGPPYPLDSDVSTGSRLRKIGSSSFKENADELKEEKKLLKKMGYSHYTYKVDGHQVHSERKIWNFKKKKAIVVSPEESLKMRKQETENIKSLIKNKNKVISEVANNKKFLDEINTNLSWFPEEYTMPKITSSNFKKYFVFDNDNDGFLINYYDRGDKIEPHYEMTMGFKSEPKTNIDAYLCVHLDDNRKPFEIEFTTI